jgi:large subunit ribosomal protein L19e
MNFKKQKQLAARALKVSPKRLKFQAQTADAQRNLKELISRESVRDLLSESTIIKQPTRGNSRTAANRILAQKKKGRRTGHGKRKGTANARLNAKSQWMTKIRALRRQLKLLRDSGKIDTKTYREMYAKTKGNFFRNKRHLMLYLEQNQLIKEEKEDGKEHQ